MGGNNQSGVDPGQTQNGGDVQNDQPDANNQTNDQGNDAILQSFYQLPDDVRQVISALPEEQRIAAINAFDQHKSNVEERMRQAIETGRKDRDTLNSLLADPNIQRFIATGELGNTDQADRQSAGTTNQRQSSYAAQYGEDAANLVQALKEEITGDLGIDKLATAVQELQQLVRTDRQNSAWADLKVWASEQGLPDPQDYQSTIASLLRNNPNLSPEMAYKAAMNVSDLQVRPPAEQSQGGTAGQSAATDSQRQKLTTESPGANRAAMSPKFETEEVDPVEEALKDRREGTVKSLKDQIVNGAKKVIASINERDHTSISIDDL